MSLSEKPFYLLTDRSTWMRYLVDPSQSRRLIFYPRKYETMSSKQIHKYERSLVFKLLGWALLNREKLHPRDRQICQSKVIDIAVSFIFLLYLARLTRSLLFKHEFMALQTFMDSRNLDVKFSKALTAYSVTFGSGYFYIKNSIPETYLIDIAHEYRLNFEASPSTPDPTLPLCEQEFQRLSMARFPWLAQS